MLTHAERVIESIQTEPQSLADYILYIRDYLDQAETSVARNPFSKSEGKSNTGMALDKLAVVRALADAALKEHG